MVVVVVILMIAVVIYLAALLFLYRTQRAKIFPGANCKSSVLDNSMIESGQVVKIDSDAGRLSSWYIPPRRGDGRTIAYFHGNMGTIADRVERIRPYLDAEYGVLLVGYPGYGSNPGEPSEKLFYQVARTNLDFLAGAGITPRQLILFGESLGSAVVVQMAIERPALAMILEAPFASVHQSAWARYPFLAFDRLIRDKFATIDKIDKVHIPLLIIHGEQDKTTPVRFGKMLLARANEPKQGIFPARAGHSDLMLHGMPEAVRSFLEALP